MWYVGEFGNLINFDFVKRVNIRKSSSVGSWGKLKIKEFVVCGVDAGDGESKIIKSFDTYEEAERELLHLFVHLNSKE